MNLPDKKNAIKNWKKSFIIAIIILVVATFIFFAENYPF